LLLPFSVFFAIRDAVAAVGDYKVNPPLNAPATGEEILKAVRAVRAAGH
jgi:xanthine dehydrogenase large subunit